MQQLVSGHSHLLVRQKKEWGEIVLGFESRNRYEIFDPGEGTVGYAAEEGSGLGALFLRSLLGPMRRATIHVYDPDGNEVGRGEKPFRFFFHRIEVYEGARRLGAIERRWAWLNREYDVENAAGEKVLEVRSPFHRFWTFELFDGAEVVGTIRKKWSGALKEYFSDADNFGVEFPRAEAGDEVRKLLLVATFLIDLAHFENNRGAG